jgi:glyoxylase-like metal-dependent hydrolase (beta-lactamase superfamily II)
MGQCAFRDFHDERAYPNLVLTMKRRTRTLLFVLAAVPVLAGLAGLTAVALRSRVTTHEALPASIGVARATSDLDAVVDVPGPLTVETVIGADWAVEASGLLNLDHPKARAAGLRDGLVPIVIAFHAVQHPTRGLFLVDTGVDRALRDDREHTAFGGLAGRFLHADRLVVKQDTAGWLAGRPVRGVFLTHLHLDHLTGMRDVPNDAELFTGPAESAEIGVVPRLLRGVTDQALQGKGALHELTFQPDRDGAFAGVLDVFGDGSFWAIHVPGHTKGSTAYLARTTRGPVLMTGDACHTRWGWENGVEPGSFSDDRPASARSLAQLRAFVAKHPSIDVRLGHQLLEDAPKVGAR